MTAYYKDKSHMLIKQQPTEEEICETLVTALNAFTALESKHDKIVDTI